jgi:hypothetical protein
VNLFDVGADGAVGGGDDSLVDTATTAQDGTYSFSDLAVGDYYVEFEAQGFTLQDQGPDDALDSDVDPDTGRTGVFSVGEGAAVTGVDAGLQCYKLGTDGLLNINDIKALGGANSELVLGNDKRVGLSYDSASETLLINTNVRGLLPDGVIVPNARIELQISVDSTGQMAAPDGVSDMHVFVDADGDFRFDAGSEDVLLSGEVMHFGSATDGGTAFFMDFAVMMDDDPAGSPFAGAFPDLVGLGWVGEETFASDFTESFATGSVKSQGFGNLEYDCLC